MERHFRIRLRSQPERGSRRKVLRPLVFPGSSIMIVNPHKSSNNKHKEFGAKGYNAINYSRSYSAFALLKIGTSGSAFFQSARKAL